MTDTSTITLPEVDEQTQTKKPWLWSVVLLDDDDHSYEYVIHMMQSLFAMPVEKAFKIAQTVDAEGRVVVMTTHRELAELKQEQVHSFGKDVLISSCAGAMSAILEPAQCDNSDD